MKSVCFTGHRNVKKTAELKNNLLEQLVKLIDEGATDFYAGGAVGWDMLCERAVIELREKYPYIKLHLVLPCPAEEQTAKWNENDKREYIELLSAADMVEICSEHYYDGCMKVRNQACRLIRCLRVLLQRKQKAQRHGADRKNGGKKAHLYYQSLEIKRIDLRLMEFALQYAE